MQQVLHAIYDIVFLNLYHIAHFPGFIFTYRRVDIFQKIFSLIFLLKSIFDNLTNNAQ